MNLVWLIPTEFDNHPYLRMAILCKIKCYEMKNEIPEYPKQLTGQENKLTTVNVHYVQGQYHWLSSEGCTTSSFVIRMWSNV